MTNDHSRPIACRLTGAGKSAVAVIGLKGPGSLDVLQSCFEPATVRAFSVGQIRYGRWQLYAHDDGDITPESVVITPIEGPHAAFEIHCHGGVAAIERILDDLRHQGVIVMASTSATAEFEPGLESEPLLREAVAVMNECKTARLASLAYSQFVTKRDADPVESRQRLLDWVNAWQQKLEDGGDSSGFGLFRDEAACILAASRWSSRLAQPCHVVLAGPANVGKSTLINRLVGYQRSITHDSPGTTRDVLEAETVLEGLPITLTDTAGIRQPPEDQAGQLENMGLALAAERLHRTDTLVFVQDARATEKEVEHAWHRLEDLIPAKTVIIHVFNKIDLGDRSTAGPPVSLQNRRTSFVSTSAIQGSGVDELASILVSTWMTPSWDNNLPLAITPRQSHWLSELTVPDLTVTTALQTLADLRSGRESSRFQRAEGSSQASKLE